MRLVRPVLRAVLVWTVRTVSMAVTVSTALLVILVWDRLDRKVLQDRRARRFKAHQARQGSRSWAQPAQPVRPGSPAYRAARGNLANQAPRVLPDRRVWGNPDRKVNLDHQDHLDHLGHRDHPHQN